MIERTTPLHILLQCAHSILGTAWTGPGPVRHCTSQVFRRTNVFRALVSNLSDVDRKLKTDTDGGAAIAAINAVWQGYGVLLRQLCKDDSLHDSDFDDAVNTLYFLSGVAHSLAASSLSSGDVVQDRRFASVEPLAELARKCHVAGDSSEDIVQMALSIARGLVAD